MISIEVYANCQDVEKIDRIPGFIPLYEYIGDHSNHQPSEWGKLVMGDVNVVFHLVSKFEEKLGKNDT